MSVYDIHTEGERITPKEKMQLSEGSYINESCNESCPPLPLSSASYWLDLAAGQPFRLQAPKCLVSTRSVCLLGYQLRGTSTDLRAILACYLLLGQIDPGHFDRLGRGL